ncbi:MAG: hypothetical protein IKJ30_03815 [Bacilli bacterium]|nr:hypothetical protein [Bacilli bacterium]
MEGFVDTLEMLKGLDKEKRESFLRFYITGEHPFEEYKEIYETYPEVIKYAYENGEEFFSWFLTHSMSRHLLTDESRKLAEEIINPDTVILDTHTVDFYMDVPRVKEKLLESRRKDVEDSLKSTMSMFLSPESLEILKDLIREDKGFVLGIDGNEVDGTFEDRDFAIFKLTRSFENDYEATMEYIRNHHYDVEEILTEEIVNKYINKNHDFILDGDTIALAKNSPALLKVSLQNDYDTTIELLEKWSFMLSHLSGDTVANLVGDKYILKANSYRMLDKWPEVLEVSLRNNYEATLLAMADMANYPFNVESSYRYFKIMEPYLRKNKFVLDENNLNLAKISMDFVDISFEHDPYNTVLALAKDRYNKESRDYLHNLDIEEIFMNQPGFIMTSEIYHEFNSFLSKDEMTRLVRYSFRNDPLATFTSGEHIYDYISEKDYDIIQNLIIENIDELDNSYNTRKSVTHLINSNPELIRKFIQDDYKVALNLLRVSDSTKYSDEAKQAIRDELILNDYVVGYKDNNPYLVDFMFDVSLKNDFDRTIEHGINELFVLDDFVKEKLEEYGKDLEDTFVRGITRPGRKFNVVIREFITQDNNILVRALNENYETTLNNLMMGDKTTQIKLGDEVAYNQVYEMLKKNNFVATKDNANLLYLHPLFLIASLENDYDKTREILMHDKLMINNISLSAEEVNKIVNILKNHNRDSELLYRLISRTPSLLVERLEKNFDGALREIENIKSSHAMIDRRQSESIMEKLIAMSEKKEINLKEHPKLVAMLSWGLFSGGDDERYQKFLISHGAPLSYIPFKNMEQIRPHLENEDVVDLYNRVYFNSSYVFNKEDEQKLLDCLHSKFDTIEDELAHMQSMGITRKDMNLTQMLALALFAKKDHYKKGLKEYKIDIFSYARGKNNLGVCGGQSLKLYNGHDESIFGMMETIIHENNHARQDIDVSSMDVSSDEDIIVYSKDKFLRTILRDNFRFDYYNENYWNISFEYDTELKAQMESVKNLRLEDKVLSKGEDIEALFDRESLTRFGAGRNKYKLSGKRMFDGEEYSLDELFELGLNIALNTGKTPRDITRAYPIVKFEYDLESVPVKRYSIEELVNSYKDAFELDKDVYKCVLRHRLNPVYNENYLDDIERFRQASKGDEELNELLESIIDSLNKGKKLDIEKYAVTLSKYLDVAERIIEEDSRMSKEEYNKRRNV